MYSIVLSAYKDWCVNTVFKKALARVARKIKIAPLIATIAVFVNLIANNAFAIPKAQLEDIGAEIPIQGMTIYPEFDTYIDGQNPDVNYGSSQSLLLKPMVGNFAEIDRTSISYGLIRFNVPAQWRDIVRDDPSSISSIKLRFTTFTDLLDTLDYKNGGNWQPAATFPSSVPVTSLPDGFVTTKPFRYEIKILGLDKGFAVPQKNGKDDKSTVLTNEANGKYFVYNMRSADGSLYEVPINYKTSWTANTTWNTAGGLTSDHNGMILRDSIQSELVSSTTFYADVTDYVVYSLLYDDDIQYVNGDIALSFKVEKIKVNGWAEVKQNKPMSIYSADAALTSQKPALVMFKETTGKIGENIYLGDINEVYKKIVLPSSLSGASISWASDSDAIDPLTGQIAPKESDTEVKLTATIVKDGESTATKDFYVTVKSKSFIAEKLQDNLSNLKLSLSENRLAITSNFTVPQVMSPDINITWSSSNSNIISVSGENAIVNRSDTDTSVVLMAHLSFDGASSVSVSQNFSFKVKAAQAGAPQNLNNGGSGGGGGTPLLPLPKKDETNASIEVSTGSQNDSKDNHYSDVSSEHWAKEYISFLNKEKIMLGDGAGNFRPSDFMKREEVAKVVALVLNIDNSKSAVEYSDVLSTEWYFPFISALSELEILKGMENGSFGVGNLMTRQDLAVTIYRGIKAFELKFNKSEVGKFVDDAEISDYAKEAVYALKSYGIINGDENGYFNATQGISRAEMSKVLYLILSNQ